MQFKNVQDLWRHHKKLFYGRSIDQISAIQMIESEKVFYSAVGLALIHLKEDVTTLQDDKAVEHFESLAEEVNTFFQKFK